MKTTFMIENIEEHFGADKNGRIYRSIMDKTEKVLIEKALERSSGSQISAAKMLGINRNTLRTKIQKLKIQVRKI